VDAPAEEDVRRGLDQQEVTRVPEAGPLGVVRDPSFVAEAKRRDRLGLLQPTGSELKGALDGNHVEEAPARPHLVELEHPERGLVVE
jgi:hypothetical protein